MKNIFNFTWQLKREPKSMELWLMFFEADMEVLRIGVELVTSLFHACLLEGHGFAFSNLTATCKPWTTNKHAVATKVCNLTFFFCGAPHLVLGVRPCSNAYAGRSSGLRCSARSLKTLRCRWLKPQHTKNPHQLVRTTPKILWFKRWKRRKDVRTFCEQC